MVLYLIRHGKISVNMNTCYGQTDYNPIETLPKEAERLKQKINFQDTINYSSPLTRCIKLVEELGIENYLIDNRLKEVHCGSWETKLWNDISPIEFKTWENDIINEPFPDGESYMDLYKRTTECLSEIVDFYRDTEQRIAIFTHGGVIRALISYYINLNLNDSFKIVQDYGHFAEFYIDKDLIKFKGFNL